MLVSDGAKKLIRDFLGWSIQGGHTGTALRKLPHVVEILGKLEDAVEHNVMIDAQTVANVLSAEEVRRAGLFAMFLTECGLLTQAAEERALTSELNRIQGLLEATKKAPWASDIGDYAEKLTNPERGLSARTQRVYLRAAVELMAFSEVPTIEHLSSEIVTSFLKSKPGHRASLFPFRSFVMEHTGLELTLPKAKKSPGRTIPAMRKDVRSLVSMIRETESPAARCALMAKLLSDLYAVPLEQVLVLPRHAVVYSDDTPYLRVGSSRLKVVSAVRDLFVNFLTERDDAFAEHERLFPGRLITDGLSVSAVKYHVPS